MKDEGKNQMKVVLTVGLGVLIVILAVVVWVVAHQGEPGNA